jgi:hypothetical protein
MLPNNDKIEGMWFDVCLTRTLLNTEIDFFFDAPCMRYSLPLRSSFLQKAFDLHCKYLEEFLRETGRDPACSRYYGTIASWATSHGFKDRPMLPELPKKDEFLHDGPMFGLCS